MREPYTTEPDERENYSVRRAKPKPAAPDSPALGESGPRLSPRDPVALGPVVKRVADLTKPEPEK